MTLMLCEEMMSKSFQRRSSASSPNDLRHAFVFEHLDDHGETSRTLKDSHVLGSIHECAEQRVQRHES